MTDLNGWDGGGFSSEAQIASKRFGMGDDGMGGKGRIQDQEYDLSAQKGGQACHEQHWHNGTRHFSFFLDDSDAIVCTAPTTTIPISPS